MAVKVEKIVAQDLNLGVGTVEVTMPGGGTAIGDKIGPQTFRSLAFIASMDGGQAITGGAAAETVELDDEELDSAEWYDDATFKFIPTLPGLFYVDAFVHLEAFTGIATVGIYKNSTAVVETQMARTAAAGKVTLSCLVELDGDDDEITLRVSHNDSTNDRDIEAARMSAMNVGNVE